MTIVILGFPRSLPGAKERREKHIQEGNLKMKSGREKANLKDILPQLKYLISNKVFLFNSLGLAVALTFTAGLVPFLGKLLEIKFGVDIVKNGYLLSSILLPAVLGMFTIFFIFLPSGCILQRRSQPANQPLC